MKCSVEETYTPDGLADAVVRLLRLPDGAKVCEPSVGGGAFVRAVRRNTVGSRIWAYDISQEAQGLQLADTSMAIDTLAIDTHGDWSYAVGNPRFGGPCQGRGRLPGEPAYIGAHHIAHVLPDLDGAAFVLPYSWWATKSVRKVLFDRFRPSDVHPVAGRVWPFLREAGVFVWRGDATFTILHDPLEWK